MKGAADDELDAEARANKRKRKRKKKKRDKLAQAEAPSKPLHRVKLSAPARQPPSAQSPSPHGPPRDVARRRIGLRVLGLFGMTLLVAVLALLYPWLERGMGWLNVGWHYGWVLLLLALVPAVWWWGTFGQDRRRPRLRLGTTLPLRRAPRGWRVRLRDLPGVLRAVAIGLFVAALAGPVAVLSDDTSKESGIDIVVAIDLSKSMQAILDADPKDLPRGFKIPKRRLTRIDTAKLVVQDFIQRRQTDRMGVVVFAKEAYILSPPTLDYQQLSKLVSRLNLDTIAGNRTAIGVAIGTAVARMRRTDANSKVVILLTDGDNNHGDISPDYAIELANAVGCKVYTIQIGDGDFADVLKGTVRGVPRYAKQKFPVNPELLKKIAVKTGGEAFIATDARGLRDSMHAILDELEKTQFEANVGHQEDLFPLFLFPGVVLLGLDALLRSLLLRRFP
jgi:Ca-activated chloride channel family protein